MGPEADVAVIGGGVVGLAAAAALANSGRSVVLLERHDDFGRETTSRSSEVVHAGLYYAPGSLKAELCVEGRERLYARCMRIGIPHRRTGKWIVATAEEEVAQLEALRERGEQNGVTGLALVDGADLMRREPEVCGLAALDSPETGIVDALALCRSLAAELEASGGVAVRRALVQGIESRAGGYRIALRDADGGRIDLSCTALVNAAGLEADRIAAAVGLDVDRCGYRVHPCKGDYFALAAGASLRLSRLVYPLPSEAGLGIHATLDLAGRLRFGPDAEFVDAPRYDVDPDKAAGFAAGIRRYLPALRDDWLVPDYAGVRPRLSGPGDPPRDFVVVEESAAGLPGFVNLIGIESPGLTAALAIGERVATLLGTT